eukprot:gene9634-9794_t
MKISSIQQALHHGVQHVDGVNASDVLEKLVVGGFRGKDSATGPFASIVRSDLEGLGLSRREQDAVFHSILYALRGEQAQLEVSNDKWLRLGAIADVGTALTVGLCVPAMTAAAWAFERWRRPASQERLITVMELEARCLEMLSQQPEGQHNKKD